MYFSLDAGASQISKKLKQTKEPIRAFAPSNVFAA